MAVINYGQAPISIATTAVPFRSIKLHLSCFFLQVGTEFLRGVSGGERKRTNIGMELIIEPQLLFLDEPTTGLDAYTAVSVVKLLKKYVTFSPSPFPLSVCE